MCGHEHEAPQRDRRRRGAKRRDGKSLPGTMDYREERRDLGIRDGKVIWVRRG
jgi:hypothetical protein